jgi:hypothetical protein
LTSGYGGKERVAGINVLEGPKTESERDCLGLRIAIGGDVDESRKGKKKTKLAPVG